MAPLVERGITRSEDSGKSIAPDGTVINPKVSYVRVRTTPLAPSKSVRCVTRSNRKKVKSHVKSNTKDRSYSVQALSRSCCCIDIDKNTTIDRTGISPSNAEMPVSQAEAAAASVPPTVDVPHGAPPMFHSPATSVADLFDSGGNYCVSNTHYQQHYSPALTPKTPKFLQKPPNDVLHLVAAKQGHI